MVWSVVFTAGARKDLRKLSAADRQRVLKYIETRLLGRGEPKALGSALTGQLAGYWRYRVGQMRIIAAIHDGRLVIEVVSVGQRGDIYR